LISTIYANLPIPFTSTLSYGLLVGLFSIFFIVDVVLIDHHRLLHKFDSDDASAKPSDDS